MRELSRYSTVERWPAGHHNPHHNIVVTHNRKPVELECAAGSSDDVHVYRDGDRFYILSLNTRIGYVGLAVYDTEALGKLEDGKALDPTGEVFLQNDSEIIDALGKRGLDLSPSTITRRLAEFIY
jgi:hypothetical protein